MASGFLSKVGRLLHGKRRDGQSHPSQSQQAQLQEEKIAGSPQVAAGRSEPSPTLYGPVQGMKKWEHSKKTAANQRTSSTTGDSSSAMTSLAWTSTRRSPNSAPSDSARGGEDSLKCLVEGSLAGPEGSGHRSGQSVLTSSQRKKSRPLSCFVAMPESPTEVRKVLLSKKSSDVSPPQKDKAISAKGRQKVEGRKEKLNLDKIDKKNEKKQKDDKKKKKKSRRPLSCIVQPPSPRPDLNEDMVVAHWPQDPAPEPPLKSKEQDHAAAAGHRARPQAERHRPRPASCFVLPPPPNYPPPPGHPQPPPSPLKATPPYPGRPISRVASPREGSPQPFYSGGSRLVRQVLSKSLEALDQISSLPKRQASYLPSSEEEHDRRLSLTIAEPSPSHYEHIHGRFLRSCEPPVQPYTAAAAEMSCQSRALYSKVTNRSNELLNLSYPETCRFLSPEQQTDYSARHRRSSSVAQYTDALLALSEPAKGRKSYATHANAMANFIHYWNDEHSKENPETSHTVAPTKISEPGQQHKNHLERNSLRNNSQNRYTKDGSSSPIHVTTAAANVQSLASPPFHEDSFTTIDPSRNYNKASSPKRENLNGCSLRHETHKESHKYPADWQSPEADRPSPNNHSRIAASSTSYFQDRNQEPSAQVVGGMQGGPRSYDLKSFFPPAAATRRAARPQSACFLCEPQPCCAQGLTGCRPVSQCYFPDCKLPGWGPGPGPDIERLTDPLGRASPRLPSTGPEAVSSGYGSTSTSTGPAAFDSRISSTPASPAAWGSRITSASVSPDAVNKRITTAGPEPFSSRTISSSAVPSTHDGRTTKSSLSLYSGGPCHRRSVSTPYSGARHSTDDHIYILSPAKFSQTLSTDCSVTMSSCSCTPKRQECVEKYDDEKSRQSLIKSENQCSKTFTPMHQAYKEKESTAWIHEKNNDKEATKMAKVENQNQKITTEGGSEEEKPKHNGTGHSLAFNLIQSQYDTDCRDSASARSSPLDNKELCGTLYTITGCSATSNLTAQSPVPKPRSSFTIHTPVLEDRAAAVHPRTSSPVLRPAKPSTASPPAASSFGSPGGFFSQRPIPSVTQSARATSAPTRSPLKKFRSVDCLDRVEESDSSSDRSPPPPRPKSSFRCEEEERRELCPESRPAQGNSSYFSRASKLRSSSLRLYRSVEDLGSRSFVWSRPDCLVPVPQRQQRPRTESSVYSYSDSTDTEQAGEREKSPERERDLVHSSSQTIQGEEFSCRRPSRKARLSSCCAAGSGHESGYFGGAGGGRLSKVTAMSASAGDILDMLKRDEEEMHDAADDELSFERCGSLRKALSCGSLLRHSSVQDKAFAVMRRRRQKMKNRRLTQNSPTVRSSSTETDEGVDLRASLSASSLNDQSDAGSRDRVAMTSVALAPKPHHEGVVKRLHSAHLKAWEVRLRRKQIQMKRRSYEMMTEDQPRRETLV